MEENKTIKFNYKIVTIVIFVLALAIIVIFNIQHTTKNVENDTEKYKKIYINSKVYYQRLNENTWEGEYHQENFNTANKIENTIEVVSYAQYLEKINSINDEISNYYSNENCNYVILSYANGYSWCQIELIDYIEEDNKIIIYGNEDEEGVMGSGSGYFIAIPTNMPIGTQIEYRECYSEEEINKIKNQSLLTDEIICYKPIIYLYPTVNTELSIKLGYSENITCSYPKYTTGWNVLAKTNGDLVDLDSGKNLYALYYESINDIKFDIEEDGFIVKGTDVAEFLEEKLAILGLTERESEEFIIYWLPKLQENKYNYIRFATIEEINANMPLEFSVEPDTLIRVLMTYKGLDESIDIKEQELEKTERIGFVAVEWGGTEIK